MFKIAEDNQIGEFLREKIYRKFDSTRAFCREYLIRDKKEVDDDSLNNLANRFSQILKGNKKVQFYDIPILMDIFEISCESILSAGEYMSVNAERLTGYTVASVDNENVWGEYFNKKGNPAFNTDEYGRTIIDYAFEFDNYGLLKYMVDKEFVAVQNLGNSEKLFRTYCRVNIEENKELSGFFNGMFENEGLRLNLVVAAVKHNDVEMLEKLDARILPYFNGNFDIQCKRENTDVRIRKLLGKIVSLIASADDAVKDYFFEEYDCGSLKTDNPEIDKIVSVSVSFMYPLADKVAEKLVENKNVYAVTAVGKIMEHNKNVLSALNEAVNGEIKTRTDELGNTDEQSFEMFKNMLKVFYFSSRNKYVMNYNLFGINRNINTDFFFVNAITADRKTSELINKANTVYNDIFEFNINADEVFKRPPFYVDDGTIEYGDGFGNDLDDIDF